MFGDLQVLDFYFCLDGACVYAGRDLRQMIRCGNCLRKGKTDENEVVWEAVSGEGCSF